MRVLTAVFVAILVFLPGVALADEITGFSPQEIPFGSGEADLTIFGTNLAGSDSTNVLFEGPAGKFNVTPVLAAPESLEVFIPIPVLYTAGTYSVDVFAKDVDGTTRHIGPVQITVIETQPLGLPLLRMPEVQVAEARSADGAPVVFDVTAESQGGTGLTVSCDHRSGDMFRIGTTQVACTATDSIGTSSGTFTIVVADTVAPLLQLPDPITTSNPVVTYIASAVDAIDGTVPVHCSPMPGSTFAFGTTTVQCSATDASLNVVYGTFDVTVLGGRPELTLPAPITVEATGASGATVTYTVTATNQGVVSCSPASGSTFAVGTTAVNCTATNVAGSASGTFNVTVTDTTPPTLVLPADITAEATSPNGAVVPYVATATDLVDGSITPSCTPASGSTFALGTKTVQCTATDAHGNIASGSFKVTVQDTTPPQIVRLKATPETFWPPDHKLYPVTVTAVVTDAADLNPLVRIVDVTSNQPINGTGDGDTAPDWVITGPMTLNLRSERSGNQDRIYTITVRATDFSGNSSESQVTVRVAQVKGRAAR